MIIAIQMVLYKIKSQRNVFVGQKTHTMATKNSHTSVVNLIIIIVWPSCIWLVHARTSTQTNGESNKLWYNIDFIYQWRDWIKCWKFMIFRVCFFVFFRWWSDWLPAFSFCVILFLSNELSLYLGCNKNLKYNYKCIIQIFYV